MVDTTTPLVVGDSVQINEWIGTVEECNADGTFTIAWDSWGGPYGSSRSLQVPRSAIHRRASAP